MPDPQLSERRTEPLTAMTFDKRLIFPAILFLCNIASAIVCFANGDWKRGLYWMASSICIASVSA